MAKKNADTPAPARARRPAVGPARPRRAVADHRSAPGPTYDEIARAAYLRYLSRGAGSGRDFDDWVEAERDLRSRSNPKSQ